MTKKALMPSEAAKVAEGPVTWLPETWFASPTHSSAKVTKQGKIAKGRWEVELPSFDIVPGPDVDAQIARHDAVARELLPVYAHKLRVSGGRSRAGMAPKKERHTDNEKLSAIIKEKQKVKWRSQENLIAAIESEAKRQGIKGSRATIYRVMSGRKKVSGNKVS